MKTTSNPPPVHASFEERLRAWRREGLQATERLGELLASTEKLSDEEVRVADTAWATWIEEWRTRRPTS